jgi:hypothetical protein
MRVNVAAPPVIRPVSLRVLTSVDNVATPTVIRPAPLRVMTSVDTELHRDP